MAESGDRVTSNADLVVAANEILKCPQYFVTGRATEILGKFMVDNGGGISMVSETFWSRMKPKPEVEPLYASLNALNDGTLDQIGLITFPLTLGKNRTVCHAAVIRGLPYDGLLGAEFFKRYGATIDMNKNRLKLASGSSIPMQEVEKAVRFGVLVADTIVVPARHEMIFPSRLDGDFELEGMVEGRSSFESTTQLMVARVAVVPQNNIVPVRVVNPTDQDLRVPKGTQLGVFTETKSLEPTESRTSTFSLDKCKTGDLSFDQRQKLETLLASYSEVFSSGPHDLGRTSKVLHEIRTGDTRPTR